MQLYGDNGIITQAQNATYIQSVAVLEEFLNNYYIEHYDYFEKTDNKAEALEQYSESSNWIWNPSKFGYGAMGYIIDKDGNACYLISKKDLPEEIRTQLKGGDAGEGTYADYASMQDVYGVTGNLKVYYCGNNGKDSLIGISNEELDKDNPLREVFSAGSNMAQLITGDSNTNVTAEEIKAIKELTIDETNNINNLNELYNLTSLQKLYLNGISLNNLYGIQNAVQLNYIEINNCNINDYSAISDLNDRLQELYVKNVSNEQVNLFCDGIKNGTFTNLNSFGITDCGSKLTDISKFSEFRDETKKSIRKLNLNGNYINTLDPIRDFTSVTVLNIYTNPNINSLVACENMTELTEIYAWNCNIGANEIYNTELEDAGKNIDTDALSKIGNNKKLSIIDLSRNVNLKWIEYISQNSLAKLQLAGCTNLVTDSVRKIKDVYNSITNPFYKSIENKYLSLFNTSNRIDYKDMGLTNSSMEFEMLYNNKDVTSLRLDNNNLKDSNINSNEHSLSEVLSTCTNLQVLSLRNIKDLSSIEFVKYMPNLLELDLIGCKVTDLSLLEEYCKNLKTLRIDNKDIDLTKFQSVISRCSGFNASNTFMSTLWEQNSLYINNLELIKKLADCTEITSLSLKSSVCNYELIDLSNCLKLNTIDTGYLKLRIVVPENVTKIYIGREGVGKAWDLSRAKNLKEITLSPEGSYSNDLDNWMIQLAKCENLQTLKIDRLYSFKCNNLSLLKACSKLENVYFINESGVTVDDSGISGIGEVSSIKNLRISNFKNLSDISTLSGLSNLQTLNITGGKISNLEPLKNLKNLTELILPQNSISSLKPLENLKNLTTLNLENNSIYDISAYEDKNGVTITYKNLDIIKNLNYTQSGSLKNIYLKGNKGIIDFLSINNLSWYSKTGF